MKRKLIIAALLLVTVPAFSQTKQSEVVASAGGSVTTETVSVSYTVGEPVVGTLSAGNVVLNQGFQQGYIDIPDTEVEAALAKNVRLYPNPLKTTLFVELQEIPDGDCVVKCFDMSGRMVGEAQYDSDPRMSIDMSSLPQGAYFVKVFVDDSELVNSRVVKY